MVMGADKTPHMAAPCSSSTCKGSQPGSSSPAAVAVNVIDTGVAGQEVSPIGQSPAVVGLDDLSMSLNSYSTIQDLLITGVA